MDDKTKLKLLDLTDQIRAILMGSSPVTPDVPVTPTAKAITSVVVQSIGGKQTDVPVTFGHVFAPGDLAADQSLDGMQIDVKALHADGSVRHAVISAIIPAIETGKDVKLDLIPIRSSKKQIPVAEKSIEASVVIILGGVRYVAYANAAPVGGEPVVWINGPVAVEVGGRAPLLDAALKEHPHLSVWFAERSYSTDRARIEVVVENDWAYEPNPQNFTYDVQVIVGGVLVYEKKNLTHYHHARWRNTFWAGKEPQMHIKHDTAYLIASRAVPNYDQSIKFTEQSIADGVKSWAKAGKEPMETGLTMRSMATTGGRGDIGIIPAWASAYLLTMDELLKDATIETANLAGSFPMHYRDKDTGQPISLIDHPYMTLLGKAGDTMNPVTKLREAFPSAVSKDLVKTPNSPDISHHPGVSYLPYLVTGDRYHLEELQFWAMYCVFSANPGAKYRDGIKGLLKPGQVRGQAWALRTLAEAAYITPDSDRLKPHLNQIVESNLDWYNAEYTENPNANKLGFIANGYAVVYGEKTGVGPWQDDFFTQAVGHAAELGFENAKRLLKWKAKFPVERMIGKGACWVHGAIYSLNVRPSATAPFYESVGEALQSMDTPKGPLFLGLGCGTEAQAKALGLDVGEMTGYADGATGYPSNMQPALAYAADYYGEQGRQAWQKFMGRTVKPNYSKGPQFAIVPRTI